jgi:hypothetical protein
MRSLRFTLFALAITALPGPAPAQTNPILATPIATQSSQVVHALFVLRDTSVIAVRAEIAQRRTPVPDRGPRFPIELALAGLATARRSAAKKTAAKKTPAKTSAAKKSASTKVPMYLDSEVHVTRDNKKGDPVLTVIKGGQLVDDTDLTDEEIDDLTTRRVIRPATVAEIERLSKAPAVKAREELVREQEGEVAQLKAAHAAALAAAAPDEKAALQEEQATELTDLQAEHVDALNAFDEKGAKE